MRILLAAQTFEGASGWHIERTLRQMGHQVWVMDPALFLIPPYKGRYTRPETVLRQIIRVVNRVPPLRAIAREVNNRRLQREAQALRPELILVIKGEHLDPKTIIRARATTGARISNWCFDDPFLWIRRAEESIAAYDHFFVVDQGYLEKIRARVPNARVAYLPQACDPDIHKRVVLTPAESAYYGNDVCIVGSMYHHRVQVLQAVNGFDLGIWGEAWNKAPDPHLRKSFRGRAVYALEKTRVFNASKIILNTHHPQAIRATNLRTFEVTGCGAFLLSDRRADLLRLYREGEEFVGFEGRDDLRAKLAYYLNHPAERERIAQKGQQRAYAEHRYDLRLQELFARAWGAG